MEKENYSKNRATALIDGIYAIAMTLLVITITVPQVPLDQLGNALMDDLNKFCYYALSFLLLATFWMTHNKTFKKIEKVNQKFLWINIFNLMFIVFIPFSTQLIGAYGNNQIAVDVFHVNLLIIGLFNYFIFDYAYKQNLFIFKHQTNEVAQIKFKCLVIPAVAILGIFIAFLSPENSMMVYLIIPLLLMYSKKIS